MATRTTRSSTGPGLLRATAVPAAIVLLAASGFSACSEIAKVSNAVHDLRGNQEAVDTFASTLQSGTAAPFEATYVTTGSAPATVVYAVQPPTGVAFDDTPSGGTGDTTPVHIVVNSSGEFACSATVRHRERVEPPVDLREVGHGGCGHGEQDLRLLHAGPLDRVPQGLLLAAGLAGDKVSSSTMTVNGFAMNCVDLVAPGVAGTSTICTTAQGILGLRQRRLRLRKFRDREVLDVAVAVTVRTAGRRHGHHGPDVHSPDDRGIVTSSPDAGDDGPRQRDPNTNIAPVVDLEWWNRHKTDADVPGRRPVVPGRALRSRLL